MTKTRKARPAPSHALERWTLELSMVMDSNGVSHMQFEAAMVDTTPRRKGRVSRVPWFRQAEALPNPLQDFLCISRETHLMEALASQMVFPEPGTDITANHMYGEFTFVSHRWQGRRLFVVISRNVAWRDRFIYELDYQGVELHPDVHLNLYLHQPTPQDTPLVVAWETFLCHPMYGDTWQSGRRAVMLPGCPIPITIPRAIEVTREEYNRPIRWQSPVVHYIPMDPASPYKPLMGDMCPGYVPRPR